MNGKFSSTVLVGNREGARLEVCVGKPHLRDCCEQPKKYTWTEVGSTIWTDSLIDFLAWTNPILEIGSAGFTSSNCWVLSWKRGKILLFH